MSTTLPQVKATDDKSSLGKNALPIFVKFGGVVNPDDLYVNQARLADVLAFPAPSIEEINARNIYHMGDTVGMVNDGINVSATMDVEALGFSTFGWLIGQDPTTQPNFKMGLPFEEQGIYYVARMNKAKEFVGTDIYLNIGVKFAQLPGGEDGDNPQQVTLYANDTEIFRVGPAGFPSFEFFKNTVADPNAAAPDGTLDEFTLGDGNRSYATAAPPDILAVRPEKTGLAKWFYYLKLNGVDVAESDATFNSTTKVITFATPPPAGAYLEMGYCVDSAGSGAAGQPAHNHSGSKFTTAAKDFWG